MSTRAHLKTALGWVVFPFLTVTAVGGAWAALRHHVNPLLIVVLASVGVALALYALERIIPFSREWSKPHGDIVTDWLHLAVSMGLVPEAGRAMLSAHSSFWPTSWPILGQLLLALLISELGQYTWHRFAHESAWGWRLHSTHHSAPRLYWLNAARFHPLESLLVYLMSAGLLLLLGAPVEVFTLYVVFTSLNGMLKHCNVALHLGPLNYLVSCAELHRWHHSRDVAESNANYGSNLMIWDLIFGTFCWEKERLPPETIGLADLPKFPQHYLGQLIAPFRKQFDED